MFLRKKYLLPLVLVLPGCAAVTYEEPKSGPVARVRFVTNTNGLTVVRSYTSNNCEGEQEMMRLREGFVFNSEPRTLGIPLGDYHKYAAKEFFIRSGTPQFYMFEGHQLSGSSRYKCGVVLKQTFEQGKDYELSFKYNASLCTVKVFEIKANTNGNVEKVLLQTTNNKLSSGFSQQCLAKFKQTRWY